MAEEASSAPPAPPPAAALGKMTMVAGVDESEHSFYALQWALQHFFPPGQPQQYRLVVVTAKPSAASAIGLAGPGTCLLPLLASPSPCLIASSSFVLVLLPPPRIRPRNPPHNRPVDLVRFRRRGRAAVRGGEPQALGAARHRQGQGALRAGGGRRVRGDGGGRAERPVRRRREARRRDARRRQPRLRSHQKGCSWKRERLLCSPRALHRDDSEEAQALSAMRQSDD